MFIKWTMMLFFFSMSFLMLFMILFYLNNFFIVEYVIASFFNVDFKFYFMFDWMSCLFSFAVLLISSMVILYSHSYMDHDKMKVPFCWMVLTFVLSMIMLIMMPNAFMLILGWDGLGLVSYLLVIFYQSTNSYNSGMMTIISNRVGDVMIIMMLVFMFNFGLLDLISLTKIEFLCGMLVIIAGLTKSAQIPFSAWLPAAMAAPTPVSSLVHSSTLVTAGVYLLIRFDFLFQIDIMSKFLLNISAFTMLMAGINAFYENDLKKIIAFSTLSQLSMMMVILSIGLTNLAFFHLIMHAIFKSMLFLGAGFIIHNLSGKQDIRMLSDFFSYSPFILSCMLISACSLMGIPFIGGFYSKDLILEYFFLKNSNLINFLIFIGGIIFTFLYNMRFLYYTFLKGLSSSTLLKLNFDIFMKMPIFILTMMLLLIGNYFFWLLIPNFSMIFISKTQKVLSLTLLLMVSIIYMMCSDFYNFYNFKCQDFFMTMWFLSKITSYLFLFSNKWLLKMSLSDWTWVEMMGPLGLKSTFLKNYKISFFMSMKPFTMIMSLLFLYLMLIL
uniref:NADH-ubiquinone oxidoreductase chain 5 n=1 Tax=Dermacentor steini TaxID=859978 RepID=A0A976MYD1_9ACAR|nr:NADH dehydrogenase subunit 5 [Dermacentor steini]UNO54126.1 NADH dehydrogenase subunit 5 [Dermacentor steini]WPQ69980.1 nad5 [Dermacentor steini]